VCQDFTDLVGRFDSAFASRFSSRGPSLLLRLPLLPKAERAFAYPEKAQAVETDAQEVEIPEKYRIAHR
jgi:hypothetical protein